RPCRQTPSPLPDPSLPLSWTLLVAITHQLNRVRYRLSYANVWRESMSRVHSEAKIKPLVRPISRRALATPSLLIVLLTSPVALPPPTSSDFVDRPQHPPVN